MLMKRNRSKRSSPREFEGVSRTKGRKGKKKKKECRRRDKLLVIGCNRSRLLALRKKIVSLILVFRGTNVENDYFRATKRAEYFVPIIWNKYIQTRDDNKIIEKCLEKWFEERNTSDLVIPIIS